MKKILNSSVLLSFLKLFTFLFIFGGCTPPKPFIIKPFGDRFSNPNGPSGFLGSNNRLSKKSSTGGVHYDDKGVFINPLFLESKTIRYFGFKVIHKNSSMGSLFNPIESIVFLNDKTERVEIKCELFDKPKYHDIIKTSLEMFNCDCNEEDFIKLINSNSVEVKINGRKRRWISYRF